MYANRRTFGIALLIGASLAGCSTAGSVTLSNPPPATTAPTAAPVTTAQPTAATAAALEDPSASSPASGAGEIVFAIGRDNENGDQLYAMALDGSHARLVTTDLGGACMPSLSPDGTRVAFSRGTINGFPNIFTIKIDGSDLREVTYNYFPSLHPTWSPDGKQIVFQGKDDLYVVATDGSGQKRLGNGGYPGLVTGSEMNGPDVVGVRRGEAGCPGRQDRPSALDAVDQRPGR